MVRMNVAEGVLLLRQVLKVTIERGMRTQSEASSGFFSHLIQRIMKKGAVLRGWSFHLYICGKNEYFPLDHGKGSRVKP